MLTIYLPYIISFILYQMILKLGDILNREWIEDLACYKCWLFWTSILLNIDLNNPLTAITIGCLNYSVYYILKNNKL